MPPAGEPFTLGVEEEYQVVDGDSLALRPRADQVLHRAREIIGESVQPELNLSQIEVASEVCDSLAEVRAELVRLRRGLITAARESGNLILASGTHPFTEWLGQAITPKERYERLERVYQQLAREQLICGCHVHVCVLDREMAIRVMDMTRPWLAPLLALSANSPFWEGVDTGYASYRTEVFGRFPTTGTPLVLERREVYDRVVDELVRTRMIPDGSQLYWDIRPSTRFDTLEFRIADVCLSIDEAVMVAGLARSLVRTCYAAVEAGEPVDHPRPELLQAARWRASRFGVEGELVDVFERETVPARQVVDRLLDHLRPDLEEHGEWDEVSALVQQTLVRGTGARRQRDAFARRGDARDVARPIADETAAA
jgi:glutamate---cysteine ligase / carboxylate-amine ligase